MIKKESYYDQRTGEQVMSRTRMLRDKFDEDKGFLLYYNGHTVNGMAGVHFPDGLQKNEIANLAILSRYLINHANFIGYRGSGGIIFPMSPAKIGAVIGMAERQCYRFLKKMIELGMMAKATFVVAGDKRVHYFINPLYFMNGRNINDLLYWTFQKQLDEYFPEWAKNRYKERREGDLTDGST